MDTGFWQLFFCFILKYSTFRMEIMVLLNSKDVYMCKYNCKFILSDNKCVTSVLHSCDRNLLKDYLLYSIRGKLWFL